MTGELPRPSRHRDAETENRQKMVAAHQQWRGWSAGIRSDERVEGGAAAGLGVEGLPAGRDSVKNGRGSDAACPGGTFRRIPLQSGTRGRDV